MRSGRESAASPLSLLHELASWTAKMARKNANTLLFSLFAGNSSPAPIAAAATPTAAPAAPSRARYTATALPFSGTSTAVAWPFISATNASALGAMMPNEP